MTEARELLEGAYRDFNARRLEAALGRMQPDVVWPNGMEGGYVHGHQGVRDYWTRQWTILDPHVEPVDIHQDDAGRFVVNVHQVVHDRGGRLLIDKMIRHIYTLRNGLIERMDID